MKTMPEVGSWVRLASGRGKQSAKVVGHLKDVDGGLHLDRRLGGFSCWNMLDVVPAKPNPKPAYK